MKGRILGVATPERDGAITSEGGQRYRYVFSSWRGDREARVGMTVDFEVQDNEAVDIYPAVGAGPLPAGANVDVAALAGSPVAERVQNLFRNTLAFPLSIVILLAFFLLPAMTTPEESPNMWNLGEVIRSLETGARQLQMPTSTEANREIRNMEERLRDMQRQAREQGSGNESWYRDQIEEMREEISEVRAIQGKVRNLKLIGQASAIRYLVPVGALLLIWLCWASRPLVFWPAAVGAVTMITGLLPWLYKTTLVSVFSSVPIMEAQAEILREAVSVGLGAWILVLAGAALIASGFGLIRNPLAR